VFEDPYPVHWLGRQAVVALPEHIDVSNASQIREELLSVINRGAATLITDMTATLSCDQSGADAVMRAYQRALASGTQLRLAVTAQIVRRVFDAYGMSRLISVSLAGGSHRGRDAHNPGDARAGRSWRPLSSHPVPVRSPAAWRHRHRVRPRPLGTSAGQAQRVCLPPHRQPCH
jgi:anti-anti-sigma factor